MKTHNYQDTVFYQFPALMRWPNLRHLVTSRCGGFNLSLHAGDTNNSLANRQKLCTYLQTSPEQFIIPQQTHSDKVAIISEQNSDKSPKVDGLITHRRGVPLMTMSADCPLIALFDSTKNIIAAVHAGWRGTLAGIATVAVTTMQRHYDSDPADIHAAIAPSIGPCCYEIGAEVAQRAQPQWLCERDGKQFLDLWQANSEQLKNCGIQQISQASTCTYCNNEHFFSYRREGKRAGRFALVMMLV